MLSRRMALSAFAALPAAALACSKPEAPAGKRSSANAPAPAPSTSSDPARERFQALLAAREKLRPLHERSTAPKPGEWRHEHREDGQTFEQYVRGRPTVPTPERQTIVVQPIGTFSEAQAKVLSMTIDYMGRYFNLPTRRKDALSLNVIPIKAKRTHPKWGDKQVLSQWVLDELLQPALPSDAAALIAFTTSDLWPADGWNFVFGQADLRARVGLWSVYRHGDPAKDDASFKLALRRALKVAVHETGHMFSLEHCTAYRCVQAGINNLEEEDRSPLWLCPECVTKIVWATKTDHLTHHEKLAAFCKEAGLDEESAFFRKSIEILA